MVNTNFSISTNVAIPVYVVALMDDSHVISNTTIYLILLGLGCTCLVARSILFVHMNVGPSSDSLMYSYAT